MAVKLLVKQNHEKIAINSIFAMQYKTIQR